MRSMSSSSVSAATGLSLLEAEFERFYKTVYRYLLHRTFDQELAEELTAETFYKSAAYASRIGADPNHLQAWLLRAARHAADAHYRRQRTRRVLLNFLIWKRSPEHSPAVGAGGTDGRCERVRAALRALSPQHQDVIVLRYYLQLSHEEIAEVLTCAPDAARARLSRALRVLRDRLDLENLIED